MILPLRKLHRRAMATLSIALPITFIIGIAGRRPVPIANSLPEEFVRPQREPGIRDDSVIHAGFNETNQFCVINRQPLQEPICGR